MKNRFLLFLIIILVGNSLQAEVIYLKNGEVYIGDIIEVNRDYTDFETHDSVLRINIAEVHWISAKNRVRKFLKASRIPHVPQLSAERFSPNNEVYIGSKESGTALIDGGINQDFGGYLSWKDLRTASRLWRRSGRALSTQEDYSRMMACITSKKIGDLRKSRIMAGVFLPLGYSFLAAAIPNTIWLIVDPIIELDLPIMSTFILTSIPFLVVGHKYAKRARVIRNTIFISRILPNGVDLGVVCRF